jgi:hypothetical protein
MMSRGRGFAIAMIPTRALCIGRYLVLTVVPRLGPN